MMHRSRRMPAEVSSLAPSHDASTSPATVPADLHVRACGLAHEGRADRGFCPKAVRAGNLACAHTMARWRLKAVLEARAAAGHPGASDALARWQALDLAVAHSDHARSEAEKIGDRAAVAAAIAAHDSAATALEILLAEARGAPPRPS